MKASCILAICQKIDKHTFKTPWLVFSNAHGNNKVTDRRGNVDASVEVHYGVKAGYLRDRVGTHQPS